MSLSMLIITVTCVKIIFNHDHEKMNEQCIVYAFKQIFVEDIVRLNLGEMYYPLPLIHTSRGCSDFLENYIDSTGVTCHCCVE